MKTILAAVILFSATLWAQSDAAIDPSPDVVNSLNAAGIRAHMEFLADDLLEGRDTGSRGHAIAAKYVATERSEEHTSELQSPCNLVCRLLLEKKKKTNRTIISENIVRYNTRHEAQRH